jgi:hypothetical protein
MALQWLADSRRTTNNTLSAFPVPATNVIYDVVISSAAGSVTSSVAPLNVLGPYNGRDK